MYGKIKLVYLRNDTSLGPGACRNIGLDIAQGKYISFCDSDDWIELNTIEMCIRELEKVPTAECVLFSYFKETEGQQCIAGDGYAPGSRRMGASLQSVPAYNL